MEATLTIQDFSARLSQDQQGDWLSQLLSTLTTLEQPEDVQRLLKAKGPQAGWCGWG